MRMVHNTQYICTYLQLDGGCVGAGSTPRFIAEGGPPRPARLTPHCPRVPLPGHALSSHYWPICSCLSNPRESRGALGRFYMSAQRTGMNPRCHASLPADACHWCAHTTSLERYRMHGLLLGKQLGEHLQREATRGPANPSTHAISRSHSSIITSTRTYAARRMSRGHSIRSSGATGCLLVAPSRRCDSYAGRSPD